jgi:peptide/nickel transport system substrate-binding protein
MASRAADGSLVPMLATKWEFPDEKTVVLTLRQKVTFHDGTPFNADAVKAAWDRVIAAPASQLLKPPGVKEMASVDVLGPYQVRVNFSAPVAGAWLSALLTTGDQGLGVPSPTAVKALGANFASRPVGAGPFEFVSYQPGQTLTLKRYKGYYDSKAYKFGGVQIIQTADGAPVLTALASGQVDLGLIALGDAAAAKGQSLGLKTSIAALNVPSHIRVCSTKAPFDNFKVRQAMAFAIDTANIAKAAFSGLAEPNRLWDSTTFPYRPAKVANEPTHDLAKAKKLMQEAGAPTSINVNMFVDNTPVLISAAQLVQSDLAKIGINVKVETRSNAGVDAIAEKPNLVLSNGTATQNTPAIFGKGGVANYCNYDNPDLMAKFAAAQVASGTPAQLKAAEKAFQEAYVLALPVLGLVQEKTLLAYNKKVTGTFFVAGAGPDNWDLSGALVKGS